MTTERLHHRMLNRCWWLLMILTLGSALIAESTEPTAVMVIAVCLVVAIKGQLVVDRLMGLQHAPPVIRGLMLGYFYLLPLLIALALIFPEPLRRMTTL